MAAWRHMGGSRLDETITLPAGTTVERLDASGHRIQRTLTHDTLVPSDSVGATVILGGWEWEVSGDAAGWAENGDDE